MILHLTPRGWAGIKSVDGKGGASQAEGPCLQRARGRKESSALEELRRVHRACVYPVVGKKALEVHPLAVGIHQRVRVCGGEAVT